MLLKFSMLFFNFFFRNGFSTLELAYKCFLFQSVSITLLIIAKIQIFKFFLIYFFLPIFLHWPVPSWVGFPPSQNKKEKNSFCYEFSKFKKKRKKLIYFCFFLGGGTYPTWDRSVEKCFLFQSVSITLLIIAKVMTRYPDTREKWQFPNTELCSETVDLAWEVYGNRVNTL